MNEFIQLNFSELQPEQMDILIAQLSDAGFEGFEEKENSLYAFIRKEDFDQVLIESIVFKYQIQFTINKLENINWNKEWESNFTPVLIGKFAGIRADFHLPIKNVEHEIIITPKMSFGTGHHATTFMMVELMKETIFKGKSVLDFGTGTGILAILSEKLGAVKISAIDYDEWSIENAKENIQMNSCERILIQKTSNPELDLRFDIILANINLNVILENFKTIKKQLAKKGFLLISGILEKDKNEILKAAKENNLVLKNERFKNQWVCLKFSN